jgi:hypothetical protein
MGLHHDVPRTNLVDKVLKDPVLLRKTGIASKANSPMISALLLR